MKAGQILSLEELPVGEYVVEIEYGDGNTERRDIAVLPKSKTEVDFSYTPKPKPEPIPVDEPESALPQKAERKEAKKPSPLFNLGIPGITHIVQKKPIGWVYLASAVAGAGAFTFSEIYFQTQRDALDNPVDVASATEAYNLQKTLVGVTVSGLAVWAVSAIISTIHGAVR